MELLLNLAWLLLALPAYWLWLGRKRPHARTSSALQFLLVLGCMLVVLFPVISATDDLCAMRAECEESPAGKHSLRQAAHERLSACKWQAHPAVPATQIFFAASEYAWLSQPAADPLIPSSPAALLPARAPPSSIV
jgi:hypothetical protein